MTWRDVLDCKKLTGYLLADHIRDAARLGYQFAAFNGSIYFVQNRDGEPVGVLTKLTVDQLDRTFVMPSTP